MTTTSSTSTSSYYQSLIDSVNGTSSSTSTSSTSSTGSSSDIENSFLTLLTTQLKNQDPLNPMDNAEITSQLAQISTVTGIEQLNSTLKSLLTDSQTTQAASLVGQSVMVPGTSLTLSSSSGVGGFVLDKDADTVNVTISDSSGTVVRTMSLGSLDAGVHDITWNGTTDSGATAADGTYKISVTASANSSAVTTTPLSLGVVRSVISGTSGFTLDLGSLGTFTTDDVKQII